MPPMPALAERGLPARPSPDQVDGTGFGTLLGGGRCGRSSTRRTRGGGLVLDGQGGGRLRSRVARARGGGCGRHGLVGARHSGRADPGDRARRLDDGRAQTVRVGRISARSTSVGTLAGVVNARWRGRRRGRLRARGSRLRLGAHRVLCRRPERDDGAERALRRVVAAGLGLVVCRSGALGGGGSGSGGEGNDIGRRGTCAARGRRRRGRRPGPHPFAGTPRRGRRIGACTSSQRRTRRIRAPRAPRIWSRISAHARRAGSRRMGTRALLRHRIRRIGARTRRAGAGIRACGRLRHRSCGIGTDARRANSARTGARARLRHRPRCIGTDARRAGGTRTALKTSAACAPRLDGRIGTHARRARGARTRLRYRARGIGADARRAGDARTGAGVPVCGSTCRLGARAGRADGGRIGTGALAPRGGAAGARARVPRRGGGRGACAPRGAPGRGGAGSCAPGDARGGGLGRGVGIVGVGGGRGGGVGGVAGPVIGAGLRALRPAVPGVPTAGAAPRGRHPPLDLRLEPGRARLDGLCRTRVVGRPGCHRRRNAVGVGAHGPLALGGC